jgi:hypothetical protein
MAELHDPYWFTVVAEGVVGTLHIRIAARATTIPNHSIGFFTTTTVPKYQGGFRHAMVVASRFWWAFQCLFKPIFGQKKRVDFF